MEIERAIERVKKIEIERTGGRKREREKGGGCRAVA